MTHREPRRMGRPPGADAAARRQAIITAAREQFARLGYSAATLSAIAKNTGISLTALYHYFDDKGELYEAVFEDALQVAWERIHASVVAVRPEQRSLSVLLDVMAGEGLELDEHRQSTAMFLATVPVDAARHPELNHLLDRRRKVQEDEVRTLVEPAWRSGNLPGFPDLDTAIRAIRLLIMGWAIETHLQREKSDEYRQAILALFGQLGPDNAVRAPTRKPAAKRMRTTA